MSCFMLSSLSYPLTVTAEWLADNISEETIKVLDATSHLPTLGRDANEEYLNCRIAGARRFDIITFQKN